MQFKITILASLLSATTYALPATTRSTPVTPGAAIIWAVSAFDVCCSDEGCVYNFDLASLGPQGIFPDFSTSCSGTEIGNITGHACENAQFVSSVQLTQVDYAEYWQVFVTRFYPQSPTVTEVVAGNVSFPLIHEGKEQSANMSAYSFGEIVSN